MLLSTSTGGPQGAQSTPQGAEARLGPCNAKQNGPRADSWLRTSRVSSKHSEAGKEHLRRGRLLCQSPQPPLRPPASLTMTSADRGRVPPAPFEHSLDRRPGRGAQLPAAVALARPPEAPLRSPLTTTTATKRSQRHACPAALKRPRAQHRTFIGARRPRPPPAARSDHGRQRAR